MNFALFLFLLLLLTGVIWALEAGVLRRRRPTDARQPWWVEYSVSFFPVILAVFVLRSFVVEPFKIPSGSMMPTLLIGDFILVNKFTYGIRLPVINRKVIELNTPQRGDVMVFRYPPDPSLDYIKRVVGPAWRSHRVPGKASADQRARSAAAADRRLSLPGADAVLATVRRAPRRRRARNPARWRRAERSPYARAFPHAGELQLQ